jgi:hypothetical protein
VVGANYTVQASTNLSGSNWFNLFSLNLSSSAVFLQDNQATNRQRFYRAQKNSADHLQERLEFPFGRWERGLHRIAER